VPSGVTLTMAIVDEAVKIPMLFQSPTDRLSALRVAKNYTKGYTDTQVCRLSCLRLPSLTAADQSTGCDVERSMGSVGYSDE